VTRIGCGEISIEEEIRELEPCWQEVMAHAVLAGWEIKRVGPLWRISSPQAGFTAAEYRLVDGLRQAKLALIRSRYKVPGYASAS
jgi:hypothetical protein